MSYLTQRLCLLDHKAKNLFVFEEEERPSVKKLLKFIALFLAFLRLFIPLFIFSQPLLAFIAFSLIDWIDYYFFMKIGTSLTNYQRIDKLLDVYSQFLMMIFGISIGQPVLFIALFIYRLIGTSVFWATNRRFILFAFPNLIEVAFLFYILYPIVTLPPKLLLSCLLLFKFLQEFFIHVYLSTPPQVEELQHTKYCKSP